MRRATPAADNFLFSKQKANLQGLQRTQSPASGSFRRVDTQRWCVFFSGISWKIARRCITWPCSCAQVKSWKLISCSSIPASSSKTLLLCLLLQGPINRASETFIKAFACYSIDVDACTTPQCGAERHRRLKAAAIHRIASYSAVTSSVSTCAHKHTSCLVCKTTSCCEADLSSSQTSRFLLLTSNR